MRVRNSNQAGFTSVEIAIVMLIASLLVLPLYSMIKQLTIKQNDEAKTYVVRHAIAEHVRIFGEYPCPAPIDAPRGAANFGREDCTIAPIAGSNGGQVLVGTVPVETLREAMDCIDATERAAVGGLADNMIQVFRKNLRTARDVISGAAGAQNFSTPETLCITDNHMLDERGRRYLYAVSVQATQPTFNPLDPTQRQIRVVDINNNPATDRDQFFVLVSHGQDARGAFNADGDLILACGAAATDFDVENCNGDSTFRDMPYSLNAGQFFDDYIDFSLAGTMSEEDFWRWDDDPGDPTRRNLMFNDQGRSFIGEPVNAPMGGVDPDDLLIVRSGNVRVDSGTATPSVEVRVEGTTGIQAFIDLDAAGEIDAANSVISPKFCYNPPMTPDCI